MSTTRTTLHRARRCAVTLAVGGLLTGASLATATPAQAEPRDGLCDEGEFCYTYNPGGTGAMADLPPSMDSYGSTQPRCYEFRWSFDIPGRGECIKNNAMWVWNRTDRPIAVFYNSNRTGPSQRFGPGEFGDLRPGLANENASHGPVR